MVWGFESPPAHHKFNYSERKTMAVNVETLEKLERKMTLTLPVETIQSEVEARLKKLARTVKMDGFRPGKVPMGIVAQRYGYSVQYEVMNDKVGEAFFNAANEANLRVAGQPTITEKDGAPEGQMAFDAVFEVFPEVKIGDLAGAEIEKVSADVSDEAIQRTVDILRKQRRSFALRPTRNAARATSPPSTASARSLSSPSCSTTLTSPGRKAASWASRSSSCFRDTSSPACFLRNSNRPTESTSSGSGCGACGALCPQRSRSLSSLPFCARSSTT